ncbi:hypothetical protein AB4114_23485, partial [Paenibacillus sp. 2RAB27]|uniref:hypothetical protein n=1 Tax=Paenibacillus sp. 2RAB27 TaxID=3232991 RepID=UPI003F994756
TIQSLDLGIENAGLSAARFTKERMLYELDQEKIVDYLMKTVYEDYKKNNKFGFAKNYLKLQKRLDTLYKNNSWRLIPGKQLLQLFIYYLMSFVGNRGGPVREDFENMAAHCCDLAELSFLRSSIEKYLNIFLNSKTG